MVEETKENQAGGFGSREGSTENEHRRGDTTVEVGAPVSRREIQRRERDGRIEMESRDRHMQDEFKEIQIYLPV